MLLRQNNVRNPNDKTTIKSNRFSIDEQQWHPRQFQTSFVFAIVTEMATVSKYTNTIVWQNWKTPVSFQKLDYIKVEVKTMASSSMPQIKSETQYTLLRKQLYLAVFSIRIARDCTLYRRHPVWWVDTRWMRWWRTWWTF